VLAERPPLGRARSASASSQREVLMQARYIQAMAQLQRACVALSALCLVVMTLIIPWGVFTRYVLNRGSEWPEPLAVLLMIVFAFFSAAACYRDNLHIAVMALPNALSEHSRKALGWLAELCMIAINLFMLIWGIRLVQATWHQVIAEFPMISVGVSYLPVPIGGAITLLFVLERLWTGALFAPPSGASISQVTVE
jgi:TRAP-type C4-dicarboxylate transport system permease small subunit